ncbi:MAG: hypothetical protein V3T83_20920 [Acidobacteriota bacterium]
MARKLLLVNLVLALAIVGLGMQLVWSWQEFERRQNIRQLMAGLQSPQDAEAPLLDFDQQPSYLDYQLIAEKNLFAADRQPPQEEGSDPSAATAPPLAPEPILHGTLTIGEHQMATVTKFEGTGRRRAQGSRVRVTLGDEVQGYKVSEITRDAIVLKWNDTEVVIEKELGGRPEAPNRRQIARGGGINIIRIGSAAAAVETTSPTAAAEQQASLLTVSRTGLAQAQGQGQRGGVANRNRNQAGANARGGASNRLQGNQPGAQNRNRSRTGRASSSIVPNTSGRPPR